MAISRKKAIQIMVDTYSAKHNEIQIRLMAEYMDAKDLFPLRESLIEAIMRGVNPSDAVEDVIDTAIRLRDIERRTSNSYVPQLRDVISPELRAELNRLN
ncbi:hypothetical protein fHeYen902_190 [Yersinia phage fHe-Yen9-02]|nr:hypothetical protein fHeYen902_190 [Yersinia phage fHe-Yen9-02]